MLPKLLRFRDLKERGFVSSYVKLKYMVDSLGFPPGRLLSPQVRTWDEAEVIKWYAKRPTEAGPARGVTARNVARKAASRSVEGAA